MATRHIGLKRYLLLLQLAHISFHLKYQSSYHTCCHGLFGVLAKQGRQRIGLYLYFGQAFGHLVQCRQAHLDTRSDITTQIPLLSRHKVIGHCRTSIHYQQVLPRAQMCRPYGSCYAIVSQRLWRLIAVLDGQWCQVVKQHELLRQSIERIDHSRLHIRHRRHDALRNRIQREQPLYIHTRKRAV